MTLAGWIISGLVLAFLLVDATMKLLAADTVLEAGRTLGFPSAGINRMLGAILLFSALLAALPRTALIGSVLVTGFLGGAIATQLRIGAPLGTDVFFGVYVGIALWMGFALRSPEFRSLVFPKRI
jgi:hypothetical protein